jgi:Domain of Unknown Function (DUF1080)
MKKVLAVAVAATLACGLAGCGSLSSSSGSGYGGAGWVTLFDGRTLDNWNRVGDANWRLEEGVAVSDKGNGFLVTKAPYADFEIRVEFWVDAHANSGIFIRCEDPAKLTSTTCYEVNIFDERPEPLYGTGAIVDVAKVSPMPKAGGHWNTYEITARGDHFVVKLNGVVTADAHNGKHARGLIGLQSAPGAVKDVNGVVKFRKVEIRAL